MTEDKLLIILDELGVQFKQHEQPERGWCWQIIGVHEWSEPHMTKDHAIAAALRHLARQTKLLKAVDDIAHDSSTAHYAVWCRLIQRAEEKQQ